MEPIQIYDEAQQLVRTAAAEPIQSLNSRELGLMLHQAENAIYLGRLTLAGLYTQQPIDPSNVIAVKSTMHDARMERNAIKEQLDKVRPILTHRYIW